jgi:membrane protein implicated in regulation of membrane protease activity
VKEFLVYTGLRILLFIAMVALVVGVWSLLDGDGQINMVWPVVIAFALSGVASYYLLNRQRDAFARKVEERAARATAAFEERRAREDQD